jgi:hypothetical protein
MDEILKFIESIFIAIGIFVISVISVFILIKIGIASNEVLILLVPLTILACIVSIPLNYKVLISQEKSGKSKAKYILKEVVIICLAVYLFYFLGFILVNL